MKAASVKLIDCTSVLNQQRARENLIPPRTVVYVAKLCERRDRIGFFFHFYPKGHDKVYERLLINILFEKHFSCLRVWRGIQRESFAFFITFDHIKIFSFDAFYWSSCPNFTLSNQHICFMTSCRLILIVFQSLGKLPTLLAKLIFKSHFTELFNIKFWTFPFPHSPSRKLLLVIKLLKFTELGSQFTDINLVDFWSFPPMNVAIYLTARLSVTKSTHFR